MTPAAATLKKFPSSNKVDQPIKKRTCVANIKNWRFQNSNNQISTNIAISKNNNLIYSITDHFAETTNYLKKCNAEITNKSKVINVHSLSNKLVELKDFIQLNLNEHVFIQILMIDRIEFVSNGLNDELSKLIDFCLKTTTVNIPFPDGTTATCPEGKLSSTEMKKSFIDVLCLSFEISFNLFIFRASYLLEREVSGENNNKPEKSALLTQLNRLKDRFFSQIYQLLDAIHFCTSPLKTIDPKLSSSHSSYSTLKILNSILDCFNQMLYLPTLIQVLKPYSLRTCFFASLADNAHVMSNKLNIIGIVGYHDLGDTESRSEVETTAKTTGYDEDNGCLYHLFYDKLKNYFGDMVYSLDTTETQKIVEVYYTNIIILVFNYI